MDQLIKISDIRDYFIFSSLHLAPKSNNKWRWIYHLSYLRSRFINYYIFKKQGVLEYTIFDKAKKKVIPANPGNTMVKRDLRNTLWHISMNL